MTPLERAYAASVGVPLPASPDAVYPGFNNQGGDFAGSVAQALRPFPQYGIINNRLESQGQSFYNAGKVDLQRRFSQGIQFGLSYTFAKLITDAARGRLRRLAPQRRGAEPVRPRVAAHDLAEHPAALARLQLHHRAAVREGQAFPEPGRLG